MRVIAGTARSLPLKTPKGTDTRPTTDRIKETLYNMINHLLPDAVFVDLFAGSGGIGIEALSRGAKMAVFVEKGQDAAKCITENLQFTKFSDRSVLLKQDVFSALAMLPIKEADVIFADPPYADGVEQRLLESLAQMSYVTEDTLIIIEAQLHNDFSFAASNGFRILKEKQYKTNKHVFLEKVL